MKVISCYQHTKLKKTVPILFYPNIQENLTEKN